MRTGVPDVKEVVRGAPWPRDGSSGRHACVHTARGVYWRYPLLPERMQSMATTLHLTADDLLRLPDDGQQRELVKGELRTMAPASPRHGSINAQLGGLLYQHVVANRLGVLFTADTGFWLSRDPDTVRCPDVAFLSKARIPPDGFRPGFFEGAPDLAVEVLSPRDTVFEVEEKVEEYLAAGARAVWVVNPKLRRVTLHHTGETPRVLHEDETLEGGDILPGFACRVSEVFDWPV